MCYCLGGGDVVDLLDVVVFFFCVVVEWGPVVRGGRVRVIRR